MNPQELPTGWYGNPRDYFDEQGKILPSVREALQQSIKRGIDLIGNPDDMQYFESKNTCGHEGDE